MDCKLTAKKLKLLVFLELWTKNGERKRLSYLWTLQKYRQLNQSIQILFDSFVHSIQWVQPSVYAQDANFFYFNIYWFYVYFLEKRLFTLSGWICIYYCFISKLHRINIRFKLDTFHCFDTSRIALLPWPCFLE